MTSTAHLFKNSVRVYATELICSTGVLGCQTFKLAFCIYNRLHSRAVILRLRAFGKAVDNIDLNLVSHRYVSAVLKDDQNPNHCTEANV